MRQVSMERRLAHGLQPWLFSFECGEKVELQIWFEVLEVGSMRQLVRRAGVYLTFLSRPTSSELAASFWIPTLFRSVTGGTRPILTFRVEVYYLMKQIFFRAIRFEDCKVRFRKDDEHED
jgi:hypothetical protein